MTTSNTVRGITLSVSASILFATMSAYTQWLSPLSGLDLLAWRVLWTLPVLLVLLWWRGLGNALVDAIGSMLRRPLLEAILSGTVSNAGFAGVAVSVGLGQWTCP